MASRSANRTLFAVVLLGAVTACSGGTPDTADSESQLLAQRIFATAGSSEEEVLLRQEQDSALADALASCMNEAGFDYLAYVAPEVTAAYYPAPDGTRYPDPAFVERYGYGIVLPILDSVNGVPPRDLQEQSNPNGEIFMGLPEKAQDAYIEAEETCRNVAIASVPDLRQTEEILKLLAKDLEGIPDRVLADQRMIDYLESWKACMSASGWEIVSPDHIDRYIEQVLNAAFESVEGPEDTISQLERVIAIEADVATSDLECGGGPTATATYEAIELEYQALVVAGNLSEVKDILDTP